MRWWVRVLIALAIVDALIPLGVWLSHHQFVHTVNTSTTYYCDDKPAKIDKQPNGDYLIHC